ncbi:MAG: MBL fold metallo-hydrolase [Hyphomonadaceae bacterium]|nr:MBL fold metallo-hydrolase [Hyphomonadaceae bacterium]
MLKWRIGDVTITKIVESEEAAMDGAGLLIGASPEAVRKIDWLRPRFANDEGHINFSMHAFVVETPTKRIVVDTCVGDDKERGIPAFDKMKTPFLKNFTEAGFVREAIDVVVCTHLHIDHVGWNTMLVDGRWTPTFPRARFLMDEAEFEHWRTQEVDPIHRIVFSDSVAPVWDAGLVDLVRSDHQICDEVRLVPTPGHTLGHVSVHVVSKGEEALITGDMVHHPCQLAHPEWGTAFDYDQAQGERTRRDVFARIADRPVLLLGTHFYTPTGGRVVRDGEVFRLVT